MRLSADAKAYARHIVISEHAAMPDESRDVVRGLIAEAFQAGMDHIKASQKRLERLAKGKT